MNTTKNDISTSIYSLGKVFSMAFLSMAILSFLILLLPFFLPNVFNYSKLGTLGDTVGGFINPLIASAAALLTFLAFYVQYHANRQVQEQFETQKQDAENNFEYNRLKERIYLINKEIEIFNVAFHNGRVIRSITSLPSSGKKYNFSGVQGMNLFVTSFYTEKEEKKESFKLENSAHSVAIHIQNLLVLVYNTHEDIGKSFLKLPIKGELIELITYTYQSKLSILIEQHIKYVRNDELLKMLNELRATYYRILKN